MDIKDWNKMGILVLEYQAGLSGNGDYLEKM